MSRSCFAGWSFPFVGLVWRSSHEVYSEYVKESRHCRQYLIGYAVEVGK